ncbi:MAG: MGMT family protein [Planctomycetota bacterium]|jgi:methylated-DNA-protein-cysteine methyltransferase-like protein|nr:MGMT family protein [Planctomycetota bacterium]
MLSIVPKPLKTDAAYERIRNVVREIPFGAVVSYGQVAEVAGGCTARMVGYAMASLPPGSDVPWHRVINSHGRISARAGGDGEFRQRELLESEGVQFDTSGKTRFGVFGWLRD